MAAEAWLWLTVALGPLLFGAVEPWSVALLQATLVLFPVVCALSLPRHEEPILEAPFVRSLLFILAIAVLQLLSPRPLLGPHLELFSTADPPRTLAALVMGACYCAFLVCAPRVLSRSGAVKRFAWVLFLLGAAIATAGLIQNSQGNTLIYGIRPIAGDRNPFGPYYNRNHAASLLAMAAGVGGGLIFARMWKWLKADSFDERSNLAAQLVLLAMPLGAIVAGLYTIVSRGADIGLAGAAGFVVLRGRANTGLKKCLLVLLMLGTGALIFRPLTARTDSSVSTRVSMYRSGVELLKDSPAFGIGLGAFVAAFSPYRQLWVDGLVDHLHSDWGEAALESGLAGFAALLAGLGLFFFRDFRSGESSMDSDNRGIQAGALVAAAAGVFHALVEYNFRIPGNAVYFLSTVSLAFAASRKALPSAPTAASGRMRTALLPVLGAFAFAVLAVQRWSIVSHDVRRAGMPPSEALARITIQGRESSSDYHFRLAFACIKRAEADSSRRPELLRLGLSHAREGLIFDPVGPTGNHLMGVILTALERRSDARYYLSRVTVPGA